VSLADIRLSATVARCRPAASAEEQVAPEEQGAPAAQQEVLRAEAVERVDSAEEQVALLAEAAGQRGLVHLGAGPMAARRCLASASCKP